MGADNPRYASGGAYDERVSVGCVCEGDIIIIIIIVAYHGGKQSGKDDERELSEQNDHQDHDVLHRQHTHTQTAAGHVITPQCSLCHGDHVMIIRDSQKIKQFFSE